MAEFRRYTRDDSEKFSHANTQFVSENTDTIHQRSNTLHLQNRAYYADIRSSLDFLAFTDPTIASQPVLYSDNKILADEFKNKIIKVLESPLTKNKDYSWDKADDKNQKDYAEELFTSTELAGGSEYAIAGIGEAITDPNVSFNTKVTLIDIFLNGELDTPQLSTSVIKLAQNLTNTYIEEMKHKLEGPVIHIEPPAKTNLLSGIAVYLSSIVKLGK